jgi:hypothetical protein
VNVLFCFVVFAIIGTANKPAPYDRECALIDRIAARPQADWALHVLTRIALGRIREIAPEAVSSLELKLDDLGRAAFSEPSVRAYAIRSVSQIDTSDALEFLKNLKPSDIVGAGAGEIRTAATLGLKEMLLSRIVDPQGRIEFLEATMAEYSGHGVAAMWAVDQLCDRGVVQSLPAILPTIRVNRMGEAAEIEQRYCEERIGVVNSHPNRARAIGSVLSTAGGLRDDRMVAWAIHQFAAMRTADADAELNRFVREVQKMESGSGRLGRLSSYRDYVQRTLSRR